MRARYSKQAKKFIAKQGAAVESRIRDAVAGLPQGDVVRLQGIENTYRLRVGGYRILFTYVNGTVSVIKIDSRGQVYKD